MPNKFEEHKLNALSNRERSFLRSDVLYFVEYLVHLSCIPVACTAFLNTEEVRVVPHLWHSGLLHGLSVSILVWAQKGEVPDAIVWQATNEARDAIFLADDPQLAYLKAEYHEASPERLARRVVLAALGELMNVAQSILMVMDRLIVEKTSTTAQHAIPRTASLADLFAAADEEIEQVHRRAHVENMPTMAWSDIPTISVTRITGDDIKPQRGGGGQPPPPPPTYPDNGGWMR